MTTLYESCNSLRPVIGRQQVRVASSLTEWGLCVPLDISHFRILDPTEEILHRCVTPMEASEVVSNPQQKALTAMRF